MRLVQSVKFLFAALSVGMVLGGGCLLLWPEFSASTLCVAFGVVFLFSGVIRLIGYCSNDLYRLAFQFDLAVGLLLLVLGGMMVFHSRNVLANLPMIVGGFVLTDSVLRIVMAKGVALGVATVVLVLPAILLLLDQPIRKYTHKVFMPNLGKVNRFVVRHNKWFVVLALILFLPALYGQNHAGIYYKLDEALPQDMPSIVATNKLKDEFNMASSHFIVMRDDLPYDQSLEMLEKLEAVDGVESVIAYDKFMSNTIPEFFIPQELLDICKRDGLQIAMINSRYETASDQANRQVDELNAILKAYDPQAKMTGEAVLTKDLIDIADVDFKVTNYISIAAIFVIIAITFRSLSVPVLLVAAIELAICINQGVPYFTGAVIPFVAPTVIGCVQLGATVDYAILMTTRFREELQKGADRESAILTAAQAADSSIITSALVLFCATLGVGLISRIEIISSICLMLARGAFISALCILLLLPALLTAFEPLINKTSLYWRIPKPVGAGKSGKQPSQPNEEQPLQEQPDQPAPEQDEKIEKKGEPIR